MNKFLPVLSISFLFIVYISCSKSNSPQPGPSDPCAGVSIQLTAAVTPTNPGSSTGAINATATGSNNLTYSLNGGTFQSSGSFTGLAVGNYTITAKNAAGCSGSAQFAISNVDLCAGVVINVIATVTNATGASNNGSIVVTSPPAAGFTFNNNGGTFQSSNTFNGLAPGVYTIIAKNSNGCTGTSQFTVTAITACAGVTITGSTVITAANACVTPANGSITITASGGTGPYTFNLNGGAFQSSNQFTGLNPNTYNIIIRDANGCTGNLSPTVAALVPGPLFNAVKQVLATNCALSGCHVGANPQNGIDLSNNCMIALNSDRIKARAVDGNPSFMPPPPTPQLSAADKQKIVAWVNAGGQINN